MIELYTRATITKLLTYLAPFLIGVGLLKQVCFYSCFGINITEYIVLSEIIILSFDTSVFILILYILMVFIPGLYFGQEKQQFQAAAQFQTSPRKYLLIYKLVWGITIFGTFTLLSAFYFQRYSSVTFVLWLLLFIFLTLFFLVHLVLAQHKKNPNYKQLKRNAHIFFHTGVVAFLFSFTGTLQAYSIKEKHLFKKIDIYLEKEIFKSDTSKTVIGQTQNYVFTYDYKTQESNVIPKSDIKKLVIKEKGSPL